MLEGSSIIMQVLALTEKLESKSAALEEAGTALRTAQAEVARLQVGKGWVIAGCVCTS